MGRLAMGLVNERALILANECVGPRLHLMTLEAPHVASAIEPGQFVHMKVPGMEAHVLRRPFSVYARDAEAGTIDILYQTVGFGSNLMATLPARLHAEAACASAGAGTSEGVLSGSRAQDTSQSVLRAAAFEDVFPDSFAAELIGPVGRGWRPAADVRHALLVGGGVGAAPLFMLCKRLVCAGVQVDVVLGAQTASALACRERYAELLGSSAACACEPMCATDDGSFGRKGFCTSLVEEALERAAAKGNPYDYVAVCGPEPLMRIVVDLASAAGAVCEVSLERRMACGIGACLSCVVDTTSGKKRACVDGPVFDAREVRWNG